MTPVFISILMNMYMILIGFLCLTSNMIAQVLPTRKWLESEFVENISGKGAFIHCDQNRNTWMITTQTSEGPALGISLIKYDSTGTLLWKIQPDYPFLDLIYGGFDIDQDGNAYLTFSPGDGWIGFKYDAHVLKYSPEGDLLYDVAHGLEYPNANIIDFLKTGSNGQVYVAGRVGSNNLFMARLDGQDGSTVWKKTFTDPYIVEKLAILADSTVEVFSEKNEQGAIVYNILRMNTDGEVLSDVSRPYSTQLWPPDFNHICENGDVLIGTRTMGYTVTRVSPMGDTVFLYKHPNKFDKDRALSLIEDDSLNSYSTGYVWENSLDQVRSLTIKFGPNGQILWKSYFPTDTTDIIGAGSHWIDVDEKFIYVIGNSKDTDDSIKMQLLIFEKNTGGLLFSEAIANDKECAGEMIVPLKNGFAFTGWSHFGVPNSTSILTGQYRFSNISGLFEPVSVGILSASPNPASEILEVCFPGFRPSRQLVLTVKNATGQTILDKPVFSNCEKLNVSEFPNGPIFIHLIENGVITAIGKALVYH